MRRAKSNKGCPAAGGARFFKKKAAPMAVGAFGGQSPSSKKPGDQPPFVHLFIFKK